MDNSQLDLSRVISVITENPGLIAQISALARNESSTEAVSTDEKILPEEPKQEEVTRTAAVPELPKRGDRGNRQKLLSAFKPYLSGERAKAIDSMLMVADILESLGGR